MKRRLKKCGIATLIFGLGAVLGPLFVISIATTISLLSPDNPLETRSEAEQLLAIYRDQEKNRIGLSFTVQPSDGMECGYDPVELFPGDQLLEAAETKRFTPYMGYFILDRWRKDTKRDLVNSELASTLSSNRSQFEIGFLRRCASWTLTRSACLNRVENLVRAAGRGIDRSWDTNRTSPFFAYGTENDVICLYTDGVASRMGLPLSDDGRD